MLTTYSHIIFIDADMVAVSLVNEVDFFCHNKSLFGVQHPGFIGKNGPFESNLKSRAYVNQSEKISIYWQACFFGGEKDAFLELTRELEERVDDDLRSKIVAVWHDESHLNKYYIEHKNNIHTYDSGYAYPESAHLSYQKKFVHLKKDHNAIRQIKTLWPPDKDRGADAGDRNYWEEECFSNKWHSVEILYPFIDSYLSNEYLIRPLRVFEFGCIPCRGVVKFCRKYGGIPF